MKPLICRFGSKQTMLKELLLLIPPHDIYVEVFFGGGALYWAKEESKKEIINDLDKAVIEPLQDLKSANINIIKNIFPSCDIDEYNKFLLIKNPTKEERFIQRLIYSCNTFNNKGCGKIYINKLNCFITKLENLDNYKNRLKNTIILQKDYRDIIKKYDSPKTFFLFDPPYSDTAHYYKEKHINYEEMNDILKHIKGKFILTINDDTQIRQFFKDFNIYSLKVKSRHNILGKKYRNELVIINYNPLETNI